jgi:protein-S-isoprenylcysteine O-methyltransferase Ste14
MTSRRARASLGTFLFLVVAPGTVAGLGPWLLTGWDLDAPLPGWIAFRVVGVALIVLGSAVVLESFARFALEGFGTPAPVAPTEHLVVGGLYKYVRNPIYVALISAIVGQSLLLGQLWLLLYAAAVLAAFVTFVRLYEEPTLSRQFGAEYEAYRRLVPGWWPRSPAARQASRMRSR